MAGAVNPLPVFSKPPVVEVVMGVQFDQLVGLHVGHLGLLWEHYKTKFPNYDSQPPLPHIIERKGVIAEQGAVVRQLTAADHIQRTWLISSNNEELLQIQNDRFIRNWRRYHNPDVQYPTYAEHNRPEFEIDYESFISVLSKLGVGAPDVDQCEITYINHIHPSDVWASPQDLGRVFLGWPKEHPKLAGVGAEAIGARTRYELEDAQGKFVGRLFLDADCVYTNRIGTSGTEALPMLQLQLSVRGRPLGPHTRGVMDFMDFGHKIIVESFRDVTTAEMQNLWGRTK